MNNEKLKQKLKSSNLTIEGIADVLKVNKSTVSRWFNRRVPAERVADVSGVTGIPRGELRPDLFGEAA